MAKPKNTTTRTFVAHGRLHRSTMAHDLLEKRRIEASILFDATIEELAKNHAGETLNGNEAQLLATIVANQLGLQRGPLDARCRIAIGQKAVTSRNNHVKHDHCLPKKYDGQPVRTIETFANNKKFEKPLVTVNEGGIATLRFPGLPPIRLYSCRPLPDDQPTYASVSVDGRRIQVSLVYRVSQKPLPLEGQWNPYAVLGIDRGIIDLIATSEGVIYEGIAQKKLDEEIKKAKRVKQAMVRKAVKAGLAGFWALLDEDNRQVLNTKGTPRRYLKWFNGKPTKEYRRAAKCLSSLLKQRARQRKAYRHQVSAQIVKYCVQREGIRVVEVYAGGTSKTCSTCGHRDKKSRKGKNFQCTGCGFQTDADHNAALNIGDRGTYIYVKRKGASMDDVRRHRVDRTNGETPERQEPGTGIDDAPPAHPTGLPGLHAAQHSNSSLLAAATL